MHLFCTFVCSVWCLFTPIAFLQRLLPNVNTAPMVFYDVVCKLLQNIFFIWIMEFLQVKKCCRREGQALKVLTHRTKQIVAWVLTVLWCIIGEMPICACRYLNVHENQLFIANSLDKILIFFSAIEVNKTVLIIVAWKVVLKLWAITLLFK